VAAAHAASSVASNADSLHSLHSLHPRSVAPQSGLGVPQAPAALPPLRPSTSSAAQRLRAMEEEEKECGICMERPKNAVLRPCSHEVCLICVASLKSRPADQQLCPFCRSLIDSHAAF
jgi:hypothetical protein